MRNKSWIALVAIVIATAGCQKIPYKPYLPEQYRGDPSEPDPTLPGLLTGKKGEYVIYGR